MQARALSIQEGDKNIVYFHSKVMLKHNKQSIHVIKNEKGQSLNNYAQISDEVVGFFRRLLGERNPSVTGCSVDMLKELLGSSFSEESCEAFQRKISHVEIKRAMFEQKADNAPGHDDYYACFFKAA
ncbi:hypothetical protein V6N13_029582 [Hibiscus sabdariffa]